LFFSINAVLNNGLRFIGFGMNTQASKNKKTLKQLLMPSIGGLLLLLLLGNLLLSVWLIRDFLQGQLKSHAQDAATSLGLSLSTVIDARDVVLAERMVDAIFDSGDYLKIRYIATSGDVLIHRESPIAFQAVPAWFTSLLDLDAPQASSQVMAAWVQLGKLEVQSHPGYAYLELWRSMKIQLLWFAVVVIVAFLLMQFLLTKILNPLRQVERQAHEMSRKQFQYRAPEPSTRELANVAAAMNEMAETLGKVFKKQLEAIESLRESSLHDALTGLHNREGFDRRLKAELESQESVRQGSLLLLKLNDFEGVNQSCGREQADDLLIAIGAVLSAFVQNHEDGFAARRSGSDFSVFLPAVFGDVADTESAKLMAKLSSLQWVRQLLRDDLLHLGVSCVQQQDGVATVLSKADLALRTAQSKGVSGWQRYAHIAPNEVLNEVRQATQWHGILQQVLLGREIILHSQPVFDLVDNELLYQQVLARIEVEGQLAVAGEFLPMAKRFNLMEQFDRLIFETVLQGMRNDGAIGLFSVSLSESALVDDAFLPWLYEALEAFPDVSGRLTFEVPEYVLNYSEKALSGLCVFAKNLGFKVIVERFGISSVPFSYLQRVAIDGIKVDHSFVRDVHENLDNQFFLRSAIQIAHSQGIDVIAVGVESKEELDALRELGVDGAMGYFLGRPSALVTF